MYRGNSNNLTNCPSIIVKDKDACAEHRRLSFWAKAKVNIRITMKSPELGARFSPFFLHLYKEEYFILSQEVFLLELYSRSQAAAMLGITVRKLDMLRTNRLIGYYQPYPGGKVQFSQAHIEKYLQRIEKPPRAITKSR